MKTYILFFLIFGFLSGLRGQVKTDTIDSLSYLEDQIYISLTYNNLRNKPITISQNGFSSGISVGFIKDIPFNQENNFGLGIGLGYGYNVYIQNLKILQVNNRLEYELATDYKTNWLKLHSIELPFEIRWRNSTLEKFKFWRVYTGIKASYVITSKSKFNDFETIIKAKNISSLNKFQYGITLSAGYSTWNLYIYYGLNHLFNDAVFEEQQLNLKDFKVGLQFYIM
tara:strand:- start:3250 stop:3927 length:678 start_codon:yes stop_codon:yes gene_type:complete